MFTPPFFGLSRMSGKLLLMHHANHRPDSTLLLTAYRSHFFLTDAFRARRSNERPRQTLNFETLGACRTLGNRSAQEQLAE